MPQQGSISFTTNYRSCNRNTFTCSTTTHTTSCTIHTSTPQQQQQQEPCQAMPSSTHLCAAVLPNHPVQVLQCCAAADDCAAEAVDHLVVEPHTPRIQQQAAVQQLRHPCILHQRTWHSMAQQQAQQQTQQVLFSTAAYSSRQLSSRSGTHASCTS